MFRTQTNSSKAKDTLETCKGEGATERYTVALKNPSLILIGCGVFLFGVSGCITTPKKEEPVAGKKEDKLPLAQSFQIPIGTVHMVDKSGKFVLIKSNRTTTLEPETKIISYGPDARMSSHLKVSPARKGAYLTADLVDGLPSVGDMVMMIQSMNKVKKDETEPSPNGFPSNVQILE